MRHREVNNRIVSLGHISMQFCETCVPLGIRVTAQPKIVRSSITEMKQGGIRRITLKGMAPPEAEMEEEMFTMPIIDMIATGRNIMRLREDAGLTVRDLQDIFGFATPQAIYKWQHGTAMPTIDNLVVLAAVLEIPMDEIIVVDANMKAQISA